MFVLGSPFASFQVHNQKGTLGSKSDRMCDFPQFHSPLFRIRRITCKPQLAGAHWGMAQGVGNEPRVALKASQAMSHRGHSNSFPDSIEARTAS